MLRLSTYLRKVLVAAACLFTGVSAQAQFSLAHEQYPTKGYEAIAYEFNLTEVATALGTDTATLAPAIRAYINAETPDPILLYSVVDGQDVAWTAATEADNHGFWMDATGNPVGWGDNAKFFASPDVEGDVFAFYVGQMPEKMQGGETATATLKLKFNSKEATFALTLNVIAKPEVEILAPKTILESELTSFAGEAELTVTQKPRTGYDPDNIAVKLEGLANLLGITNTEVLTDADNLDAILYTTQYITDGDNAGLKKDSLTNTSTANAPGFWFRQIKNEDGDLTGEASATGYNNNDCFYIEGFKFDAATDTLIASLGQYPGTLKGGEKIFANLYFLYGEKAYKLKVNVNIEEVEAGNGMADYTKVGEETKEWKQEPREDYASDAITVNVDSIAALLGVETSTLQLVALDDKDNFASSTANNGGWWFTRNGDVTSWGDNADFFIEPAETSKYGTLNLGHFPDHLKVGDEGNITLYFIGGQNYYQYNLHITIAEAEKKEYNFESVATRNFILQQLLDNDYTMNDLGTISGEDLEALIGTASPVLYGLNVDSIAAVEGQYTKKWTCDPKPGFWLSKEGFRTTWGNSSYMGIVYADGKFRGCQMPSQPAVGDVFKSTLFLVNEETEKMITFKFQISFVETLEQKEVVGTENIVLPVSTNEAGFEIDLSKAATALSTEAAPVTVADLLNSDNYYLRGMKDGAYGEGQNCTTGLAFSLDGGYDGYGDIYIYIDEDGTKQVINVGANNAVAEDFSVDAQFCFEVNNRQYVYAVKFVSPQVYETGIATVNTAKTDGAIYDLQGRRVVNAQRGLYIIDGKKMVK